MPFLVKNRCTLRAEQINYIKELLNQLTDTELDPGALYCYETVSCITQVSTKCRINLRHHSRFLTQPFQVFMVLFDLRRWQQQLHLNVYLCSTAI
jgi:hypothetical protein